jgi:hypothetical protein
MDDWVLDARVDQIRAFVSVLGALKLSKRQLVQVSVAERGVTIVAQDLSKSLQAQVNFRAETFLSYRVNAAAAGTQGHHGTTSAGSAVGTFGLDLGSLIDVLNAFAPLDGECDLSMRWPDRDNALVLAAVTSRDGAEPERPVRSCMHASIAPEVDGWSTTSAADAELIFRGERNAFMMPTTALREIVDDLEWPNAPMTVTIGTDPHPKLSFSSRGKETGTLTIDVDARAGSGALTEFTWLVYFYFLFLFPCVLAISLTSCFLQQRTRELDVPVPVRQSCGVLVTTRARRSSARAGGRVADDEPRRHRRRRRDQDRPPGPHEQNASRYVVSTFISTHRQLD